jgi:hypothetical protein
VIVVVTFWWQYDVTHGRNRDTRVQEHHALRNLFDAELSYATLSHYDRPSSWISPGGAAWQLQGAALSLWPMPRLKTGIATGPPAVQE